MFKKFSLILSLCLVLIFIASCDTFYQKTESNNSNKVSLEKLQKKDLIEKNLADNPVEDIKEVMKYFSKYYLNTWQYESLLLNLFANNDDVSIIFPYAYKSTDQSWVMGKSQIKHIFQNSLGYWSSFKFNEDSYKIIVNGNSAYLTANGEGFLNKQYEKHLKEFTRIIYENLKLKNESRFNRAILSIFDKILLHDKDDQVDHDIPFVVSVYLVRTSKFKIGEGNVNKWKIQSMHFSLPIDFRSIKDIRLL